MEEVERQLEGEEWWDKLGFTPAEQHHLRAWLAMRAQLQQACAAAAAALASAQRAVAEARQALEAVMDLLIKSCTMARRGWIPAGTLSVKGPVFKQVSSAAARSFLTHLEILPQTWGDAERARLHTAEGEMRSAEQQVAAAQAALAAHLRLPRARPVYCFDNDSIHRAARKPYKCVPQPPYSPDFNKVAEHTLAILSQQMSKKITNDVRANPNGKPPGIKYYKKYLLTCFNKLKPSSFARDVNSLPATWAAVLQAGGGWPADPKLR